MVCLPQNRTVTPSSGEKSTMTITKTHNIFGDAVWTQQSGGCGEQGEQIYGSYIAVGRPSFGKEFVREWAKFRYGIFEGNYWFNNFSFNLLLHSCKCQVFCYRTYFNTINSFLSNIEHGFARDPVYPKCFMSDRREVNGCSDSPIDPTG